jgi:hypothetical protein
VLLVVCCSVLDAWLTLCHPAGGGREAKPVIVLTLTAGPSAFLGVRIGLSVLCAWILAAHQNFTLAMQFLYGMMLGYGGLLCYHLMLVLNGV